MAIPFPFEPGRPTRAGVALFVVSILAGFWCASMLGRRAERRASEANLEQYAERLMTNAAALAAEGDYIFDAVKDDGFPPCSDADLDFMRGLVFHADNVRDIGRTRGNMLLCASGVGRLAVPLVTDHPDIQAGGVRVSVDRPLLLAKHARGFVLERSNVSIVLNPSLYARLDEPPMFYTAWLYLRHQQLLIHSFGHSVPLSDAEVIASRRVVKNGILYLPRCSARYSFCIAASEAESALNSSSPGTIVWFRSIGAVLGGLLAAIALLLLRSHRSIQRQLRRAVARGSLTVEYQPIVELCTDRIVSAEALVRWVDDTGQAVRPELFIALAEDKRFVGEITRHVASTAIREMGELLASGFRVTLNITSQDLTDTTFAPFLKHCLESRNLSPTSLGLELTERSTTNHPAAIASMQSLKANGHAIYIDDFGTGYSSLAYLVRLDVDAIKIDRAFTQTIGTEAVTAPVVPQILAIARELDLLVVVEGIETREQAEYFAAADGRILGQGWYFGHPIPAAEFRERLRRQAEEEGR